MELRCRKFGLFMFLLILGIIRQEIKTPMFSQKDKTDLSPASPIGICKQIKFQLYFISVFIELPALLKVFYYRVAG